MHADSSICHLRDAENLLTATRLDDPTPAGTETPDADPSFLTSFLRLCSNGRRGSRTAPFCLRLPPRGCPTTTPGRQWPRAPPRPPRPLPFPRPPPISPLATT